MQRKLSCLALLLLTITDVMAVEWSSIIEDDKHQVLVDIDSYNVTDNYPYLLAKTVYKKPQNFVLHNEKIQYFISIQRLQFNCKQPLYRLRYIELMNQKEKLIKSIKVNSPFKKLLAKTDEIGIGQLTCQVHEMIGGQ